MLKLFYDYNLISKIYLCYILRLNLEIYIKEVIEKLSYYLIIYIIFNVLILSLSENEYL